MTAALLAGDWGGTNLRVWTLDEDGRVASAREFPYGVTQLGPGEAARRFEQDVRPALRAESLPAILCGMVGSTLGWRPVPYLDCPAALRELAGALTEVESGPASVRIVPGLKAQAPWGVSDVMRGEETQIFGWLAADPARTEGRRLICHPGTHAKWVLTEGERITGFQTAMTGELFALLRSHGVLATPGEVDDEGAFDEGVAVAGDGQALAARLFSARARIVADLRPSAGAASYLSGLLIGAEVASTPLLLGSKPAFVDLLGDLRLCRWYQRALAAKGIEAALHDGETAARHGLFALHQMTEAKLAARRRASDPARGGDRTGDPAR